MNVELQEDFKFSTGARTDSLSYTYDFIASSVQTDDANQNFVILAREPPGKGKGVDIRLTFPYAVIPSLMEAVLKSLSDKLK